MIAGLRIMMIGWEREGERGARSPNSKEDDTSLTLVKGRWAGG